MSIKRSGNVPRAGSTGGIVRHSKGSLITNVLGNPTSVRTTCVGQLGGSVYGNLTFGMIAKVDILLNGSSTGRIFEGGASGWGLMLYCWQGRLIYECGRGGTNMTGPTGPSKNLRGYTEWTIPEKERRYIIEVSARSRDGANSVNSGAAYLRVNGRTVSQDAGTWRDSRLAGSNQSHGCGGGNSAIRANQSGILTDNNVFFLQNATFNRLDFWRNQFIIPYDAV